MGRPSVASPKPRDMSLKALIGYYINHYRFNEISDEHNYELKLRFENYNMIQRKFTGPIQPREKISPEFEKMTDTELLDYFNRQTQITTALNIAMSYRFSNYNVTTRQLISSSVEKTPKKVTTNKVDYKNESPTMLKRMYNLQSKKGEIDPELNKALGRAFPDTYDMVKHCFNETETITYKEKDANGKTRVHQIVKKPKRTAVDEAFAKSGRASEMDNYMQLIRNMKANWGDNFKKNTPLPDFSDDIDDDFDDDLLDMDDNYSDKPAAGIATTGTKEPNEETTNTRLDPPHIVKLPNTAPGAPLVVEKYEIKNTSEGTYNRVTVNGTPVLNNHIDTEIRTFMDGRILGVRGIATEEKAYPQKTTWQLYPMIQGFTIFSSLAMFNDYYVYIKSVAELPTGEMRLTLSNNSQIIFSPKQFDRLTNCARFKIKDENTR